MNHSLKYKIKTKQNKKKTMMICPDDTLNVREKCNSWKKSNTLLKCPKHNTLHARERCSNLFPPKGYYCKKCKPCKCRLSGLNFYSCGELCCSSVPGLQKKNYTFGSPTHYDGTYPCYKKCPKGMTSKGNGHDWDRCYRIVKHKKTSKSKSKSKYKKPSKSKSKSKYKKPSKSKSKHKKTSKSKSKQKKKR